ncbi:phosphoenolpyruvate--protein phosphotransferase [Fodinibius halophilus]|uniref:Phosphoenolpyruvate-protein phosphotransferase n=1 Tax=Fodinibius halophilus TaxID=1736908 RepID=A0A6M1TG53_9BACT|nr:phosphoenolpyruvate--protein phosphotransferase [Fodinibius halophilus]NGP89784.1 phosphoenolpyruvate--protein phosphotransferase [Fodinibius halophilus]
MMLSGAPGAPGIVIGKASTYKRRLPSVSETFVTDGQIQYQLDEFQQARTKVENELNQILSEQDEANTEELVRMQVEVIKDPELNKQVKQKIIDENLTADAAVDSVFETYLRILKQNQAEDRSVDITDIRDRLIQVLHNYDAHDVAEGAIVIANELSPREVIEFADQGVKGIVMDRGGVNSHAAIIARSMGLPTVLGTQEGTSKITGDDQVVVDGRLGKVIVNPDGDTQERYRKQIDDYQKILRDAKKICQHPNKTKDGISFSLRANIEFVEELEAVEKYCAEGIGLLRTESIYLRNQQFKNVDEQESFYIKMLENTAPHPVVIRLFDAGGDKVLDNSSLEQNPFLGWRGIRMLLDQEELLEQQLKAICKAAAEFKGRVRILIPMVSTIEHISRVRALLDAAQEELSENGVEPDKDIELGIMVEVPNVALQADFFAQHVDFMSIGTNDLTQYLLAVDRGNERISKLYDQRHPAVWKLINRVSQAAQKESIPLSICGELASDPVSACCLVGMGIDDLSMNAAALPAVKKALRSHESSELHELAQNVLDAQTIGHVNELFSNWNSI